MKKSTKKGKPETGMDAVVLVKLTEDQINERARRLAKKQVEMNKLEKRRRNMTRELGRDINALRAEMEKLGQEVADGEESVKQGDLFVDGSTKNSKGGAVKALAEVVKHSAAS